MGDKILARRYARAIYNLVHEEDNVELIGQQIRRLEKVVSSRNEWVQIMDDPGISIQVKQKLIHQLVQDLNISPYIGGVFGVLAEKKRMHLFSLIVTEYNNKVLLEEGVVEASVSVADEKIWTELKNEIVSAVEGITGRKSRLSYKVDKSIIGGMVIKIGNVVYDGSVKAELERVKKFLLEGLGELGGVNAN